MENEFEKEETTQNPTTNHVVLSSDDEDETQNNYQIVVYNPNSDGLSTQFQVDSFQSDPIVFNPPPPPPPPPPQPPQQPPQKVLPAVGSFTVQCAMCYKWRLIPTKEKYEEIREHILEQPFTCELAKEWRPNISCQDEGDLQQDDTRLWAIDRPNIAQPPPGWERELRIRGEGGSKFADVYYISPAGKRLRSMVEVQRYLLEHPEFMTQGVTLSQFSFRIPKPLRENYVRKRPARLPSYEDSNFGMPKPLQTIAANPISWAPPDGTTGLELGPPAFAADIVIPPVKKRGRPSTKHTPSSNPLQPSPHKFKIKSPQPPLNGVCGL